MTEEKLGPYTLIRHIGSGGMGEVHLAHDPRLDRNVALKVLQKEMLADDDRRQRFQREAKSAAGLNHPSITTIHEVGQADGRDFIAQEFVEGKTLTQILLERRLALTEVADFAMPLADALSYAHEQRVIHRDIKPGNVMLTDRGLPKLLDFGLAKVLHDPDEEDKKDKRTTTLTSTGAVFGTPSAMSPEQALGRDVDHRSDVFSFGSLLYEMATGRPAFLGETVMETLDKVLHADPEPLSKVRRDLPTDFIVIVEKALRKDPNERYQSMSDMAADLRHFKRQTDSGLVPPAADVGSAHTSGPRLAIGGALLLAAFGVLGWQLDWFGGPDKTIPAAIDEGYTAVMYVANLDDDADANRHGSMLARLLTTGLSSGGGLEMLSQQRLYDVAKQSGLEDGRINRSSATQVAQDAGVRTMIIGEIGSLGSQLVATTDLVDLASGRSIGQAQAKGAGPDDLFLIAEELSSKLRDLIGAPIDQAERQALEKHLTSSVDAYRAYVRGQELMDRNVFQSASDALAEATELDPAFALAWFWQAIISGWNLGPSSTNGKLCIQRAEAFRDRLPPDIAKVLDAAKIYMDHDYAGSLPLFEEIVEEDPDLLPAHYMMGEIFIHSSRVNDIDRAIAHFERVLEIDPEFSLIYEHITMASALAGDFSTARSRLPAWEKNQPEIATALHSVLDAVQGRHEGLRAAAERNSDDTLYRLNDLSRILTDDWSDWDEGLDWERLDEIIATKDYEGLREVRDWRTRSLTSWRASFERVIGLSAQSFPEAIPSIEEIKEQAKRDDLAVMLSGVALHRLARIYELRGEGEKARETVDGVTMRCPQAPRALYVAAKFAGRDGDLARARELLTTLESLLPELGPLAPRYRDALAAEVALAEGDTSEARRLYEGVIAGGRLNADYYAHMSSVGPMWREGLARACFADGEPEAAARAWRGLLDCGYERFATPILWTVALYELGVLELELGRHEEGRAHLERFLESWGESNPDLSIVIDARRLLGE